MFGLSEAETVRNLGISVLINVLALVTAMVAHRFVSNVKHWKHLIDVFFLQYVAPLSLRALTMQRPTNPTPYR